MQPLCYWHEIYKSLWFVYSWRLSEWIWKDKKHVGKQNKTGLRNTEVARAKQNPVYSLGHTDMAMLTKRQVEQIHAEAVLFHPEPVSASRWNSRVDLWTAVWQCAARYYSWQSVCYRNWVTYKTPHLLHTNEMSHSFLEVILITQHDRGV